MLETASVLFSALTMPFVKECFKRSDSGVPTAITSSPTFGASKLKLR